ncbi:MAG: RidA family protein [Acidobacteriota bacterium]
MSDIHEIRTDDAPPAIGPYAQAVRVGNLVYTSGQIGMKPGTTEIVAGGFEPQAVQVLANLKAVLAAAGCTFGDVVKTTIFVADMDDFARLNELYGEAMGAHRPARSTVQAARLPKDALVEIEMIVRVPDAS